MATETLTPTTELEAVNEILATIGEAPVGTLVGALPVDASTALKRLRSRSRTLQSAGWSFNTDFLFSLAVNSDGEIPVPPNALSVDIPGNNDFVWRSGKIYDRANHTFQHTAPVEADIVRYLPFEDLPEYARQVIFISAARKFQDQLLGDEGLHQFTQEDEQRAWSAFLDAEAEHADYNVLSNSTSVQRVIRKRGIQ